MEKEAEVNREIKLDNETDAMLNDAIRTERERIEALLASDKAKKEIEINRKKDRRTQIIYAIIIIALAVTTFVLIRSFESH